MFDFLRPVNRESHTKTKRNLLLTQAVLNFGSLFVRLARLLRDSSKIENNRSKQDIKYNTNRK